jgi:hypothetical protein
MTPHALASKISNLPNRAPITAELTSHLWNLDPNDPADSKHLNMKKSWLRWLDTYEEPKYSRRKDSIRTAGFVYNHLLAPQMVLWLGEVSGVSETVVRNAMKAACSVQPNRATQCASIRKIIPWKIIEYRLNKPTVDDSVPTGTEQIDRFIARSLTKDCVYTIVEGSQLDRLFEDGREVHRELRMPWVKAENMFHDARAANKDLPVLFGDAAHCSRLLYWGLLKDIHVQDGVTSFVVGRLRKIRGKHKTQELVLCSKGRKIADNFRRPYAICVTPKFLNLNGVD